MQTAPNSLSRFFLITAVVMACSVASLAQFRAGVQGVVTDGAGGIVPGATVTLTKKDTNQTQTTQTNDDGFYRFASLTPGIYSISVEKETFSKALVDDVKVDAEAIKGQDIVLQAGAISETVTVEADAAALQTEDASIRKTVTSEEIQGLPQIGRDPYELIRLTPGIVGLGARAGNGNSVGLPNTSGPGGSNSSIFQTENAVPISANGQRGSSNNFQIDGVSVNSQSWGGSAIVTPSQEIVKEIQVLTSTYSAEDGRNSGAQIKTITQNGTNDWHGSLFFKHTDPSMNAFNKMPDTIQGIGVEGPRRVERKYQSYGGSIGGQLPFFNFGENDGGMFRSGRDRSWFFFAYEGLRENTNVPYYSWIETEAYRNAILTQRAGTPTAGIVGAPGGVPRTLQLLTPRLTAQNRWACGPDDVLLNNFTSTLVGNGIDFGSLTGTYGNYAANNTAGDGLDGVADLQCAQLPLEDSNRGNQYFGRLDFQMTDRSRLAFTATIVPFSSTGMNSSSQSRPQADFTSDRLNFATAAIWNHTFNATTLNEARFSYSGWDFDEIESNPNANFGIPRVEVEAIWGGRLRWGVPQPGTFKDRQYNFRDTFTTIFGNHVLKLGGEYSLGKSSGGQVSRARPLFSFVRPWNFANGTPVFESVGLAPSGKPTPDDTIYHTSAGALFVQDDWKALPNLTLNLGLRWEFLGPITPDRNIISNLILGPNGGLDGSFIDVQDTLTDPDWNNFGPQFGFAWSPDRFSSKLVIRGGIGLAYDRLANALLNNARRNPGAPTQLFNICCPGSTTSAQYQAMNFNLSSDGSIFGFPVHNNLLAVGAVEIYGAPRDLPNASVLRYSVDAQYELPWRTVASLGYSGSRGRNFVRIEPLHITRPGEAAGQNQFGAVYFAMPDVKTDYNALISSLRTRFYKGLSLIANYTFGKSLDTVSWEAPCACTNQTFPVDQDEEYGRSDFDTRHNFNFSAVWDLPFYRTQSSLAGKLLGGWQVSTIVTYNTGYPWTPRTGGCLQGATTSSSNFCDPRPIGYDGTQPLGNSDEDFLNGGPFPGSFIGGACNNPTTNPGGCNSVFTTPFNSNQPFENPPGVGRNVFFGPKYFSTDLSIGKRFGLWSETAGLDIKLNFFNVFNQLNFAPFGANSNPTHVDRAQFGIPTAGLAGRTGEIQARFSF
ncbi:MAG: carboxypeptidase regulatory-like domain-containing protein [Pyrinomonadaceae bacterium]